MSGMIKLTIEYDGGNYHGWQAQSNARSVQVEIETAITKLTGEQLRITGAGRTDSGVHALGQVASFELRKDFPVRRILPGLNAHLPEDIRIVQVEEKAADFNARFSATGRYYEYRISTIATAINRRYCWPCFYRIDYKLLDFLAGVLPGNHDFGAFARAQSQSGGHDKRCIVYHSGWQQQDKLLIYRIAANRFLHGMVRTLVGTMVDVARGQMTLKAFEDAFQKRDRRLAGPAAPPQGLFLKAVFYDKDPAQSGQFSSVEEEPINEDS